MSSHSSSHSTSSSHGTSTTHSSARPSGSGSPSHTSSPTSTAHSSSTSSTTRSSSSSSLTSLSNSSTSTPAISTTSSTSLTLSASPSQTSPPVRATVTVTAPVPSNTIAVHSNSLFSKPATVAGVFVAVGVSAVFLAVLIAWLIMRRRRSPAFRKSQIIKISGPLSDDDHSNTASMQEKRRIGSTGSGSQFSYVKASQNAGNEGSSYDQLVAGGPAKTYVQPQPYPYRYTIPDPPVGDAAWTIAHHNRNLSTGMENVSSRTPIWTPNSPTTTLFPPEQHTYSRGNMPEQQRLRDSYERTSSDSHHHLEPPSPAYISPKPSRLLRDGAASPAMSMSIYSKESEDDGPYSGMRDEEDRPGQANVTPLEASVAHALKMRKQNVARSIGMTTAPLSPRRR